jgi:hypothetical protein
MESISLIFHRNGKFEGKGLSATVAALAPSARCDEKTALIWAAYSL